MWVVAPFGFVVANLVVYWSSWPTVWRLEVALAIGFLVFGAYLVYQLVARDELRTPRLDLRSAAWLPPYLVGHRADLLARPLRRART